MPNAVKLHVFVPDGLAQPAEAPVDKCELNAIRDAAYREGFEAGARASAEEHASAQDQLKAGLVEAIRDQQMDRAAAQAAILQGVLPLIGTLIDQLAPDLARAGLGAHAARVLSAALSERPDLRPILTCAPDAEAALSAALEDWSGAFDLKTDPLLTPLEAKLHWADGFDHVELGTAIEAVRAEIAALQHAQTDPANEEILTHAG